VCEAASQDSSHLHNTTSGQRDERKCFIFDLVMYIYLELVLREQKEEILNA